MDSRRHPTPRSYSQHEAGVREWVGLLRLLRTRSRRRLLRRLRRGDRCRRVRLGFRCGPVARRRGDINPVALGPLDEACRQLAKRVDHGLRLLLVDLVEHRREDPPRLEELRGGDRERLVASSGVEQHALVGVATHKGGAVAKLRSVPQPHRHRRAALVPANPSADARRLRDSDHVQRFIRLHPHHQLVVRVHPHHLVVRLRLEADAHFAQPLVQPLARRQQERHPSPPLVVDRQDTRGERRAA
mmetsp:Transcript_16423/g.41418  ORF Transcript_16423/g.41418 Transcript_16423/m.41418 type:complete len:244 (-) Transcript_16423:708-1439(-)